MRAGDEADRVAVGRAFRHVLGRYDDARAGPEIHQHALTPMLLQLLGEYARQYVVGAAGRLRHDDRNRPGGKRRGGARRTGERENSECTRQEESVPED